MTDQDALIAIAGALLGLWWLVKHPEAAKAVGLALLFGLVFFGAAHAATHGQRHHRSRYRRQWHHLRETPRGAHHRRR
jgi:hypothetical protein